MPAGLMRRKSSAAKGIAFTHDRSHAERVYRDLRRQFSQRKLGGIHGIGHTAVPDATLGNLHRQRYELVTSQYVLDEADAGSETLARERIKHLAGIALIPHGDQIDMLGEADDDRAT